MEQSSLFDSELQPSHFGKPLADLARPQKLEEILGQEQVLGPHSKFRKMVQSGYVPNLIFWGPPGSGKTTMALAVAKEIDAKLIQLNAVSAGTKEIREAGHLGNSARRSGDKRVLLFLDEIHRLNKSQQDVLLPFLEAGDISLIGATTENPSYELNRALLSRSQVIVLKALDLQALKKVLQRGAEKLGIKISDILSDEAIDNLIDFSDGDARRLLNSLETLFHAHKEQQPSMQLNSEEIEKILGTRALAYDKNSEYHYDLISAFIKSVRGSDPDAALYYMVRMLKGGEDPVFISRRLIVLASEDVGNADPRALPLAVATLQAVEAIGMPEAEICLSQAVTYLASCPKSNRSYQALRQAQEFVESTGSASVPLHLRSSKTALSKGIGYGRNYQYPHDFPKAWIQQNYWPENIKAQKFYEPSQRGFEKQIKEFQNWLKEQKDSSETKNSLSTAKE